MAPIDAPATDPGPGPAPDGDPGATDRPTLDGAPLVGDLAQLFWREDDAIVRTDARGGDRVELVAGVAATALALAGDRLVYSIAADGRQPLWTVAVAGGAPVLVADDVDGFAADREGLVWTTGGALLQLARGATAPQVVAGSAGLSAAGPVAVDGAEVYVAVREPDGRQRLARIGRRDGEVEPVAPASDVDGAVQDLIATAGRACWIDLRGLACARAGSPVVRVVGPVDVPRLAAADGVVALSSAFVAALVVVTDDAAHLVPAPARASWGDGVVVAGGAIAAAVTSPDAAGAPPVWRADLATVGGTTVLPPGGTLVAVGPHARYEVEPTGDGQRLVAVAADRTRATIASHPAIAQVRVLDDTVAYVARERAGADDTTGGPGADGDAAGKHVDDDRDADRPDDDDEAAPITSGDDGPGTIWLATAGAAPRPLAARTTSIGALTLTASAVTWLEGDGVWSAPRAGGGAARLHPLDLHGVTAALVVDGDRTYVRVLGRGVFRLDPGRPPVRVMRPFEQEAEPLPASAAPVPDPVAAGGALYLTDGDAVWRLPRAGAPRVAVRRRQLEAALGADGSIYVVQAVTAAGRALLVEAWLEDEGHAVFSVDVRTGRIELVLRAPASWGYLALFAAAGTRYLTARGWGATLRL